MIFIFSSRPPEPIDENMRPAIEDDREWFRLHPDRSTRVRPRIPGEFGPLDDLYVHVEFTIITRQPDGSRHRRPLFPMSGEAGGHERV
jgi:hypothetical protein